MDSGWSSRSALLPALLLLASFATAADALVFHTREEALGLAFPDADRVETQTYILHQDEADRVEALAHSKLDSKLVNVYRGYRGDELLGYAMIDMHNVRTLPEAFMVVLSPDGSVRSLRLLAFHEPLEYKPGDRWYEQFDRKSIENPLRLGGDIHGVVGATLSSRATTLGVRRALALYEVVIQNGRR